ncbi:ankyrin repeat domain-containing protein [Caulobacter sp. KR2-114]|uniref:ankyrin repeat domain-containing protein n=1 Tax=Caulobacter sp. KR2-114 TaxID=3400912 RepID=UPI003C11C1CB
MPDTTPPVRSLTAKSNLDALRGEARRWRKAITTGDARASERFRRAMPGHAGAPKLREVQQALAREHGFASWAALRQELEDRARTAAERVRLFLEKAANRYGTSPATRKWGDYEADGPARGALAARLLARHPELARRDIHTAVAAHDLAAVRGFLQRDPDLVRDRSDFDGWTPLLRLAYARLPAEGMSDALSIATLLLDAGADPDAGWSDETPEFTPLVGVIGGGEAGQSEHPQAQAFADLLLARGADPMAAQALYNTSLGPDSTEWLQRLWSASAARGETGRWTGPAPEALGGARAASALAYLLGNAVPDHIEQARWLLAHGADANGVNFYSREPVIKHALLTGRLDVVALLEAHGAVRPALSDQERFLAAAATGDLAALRHLAQAHPAFLGAPEAMFVAIRRQRAEVALALLDLGMSPDVADDKGLTALHVTTHVGAADIARLLIDRGAAIDPFEQRYGGAPLTHAIFNGQPQMAALIAPFSHNFRGLCFAGATDRLRALLAEAPDRANRQDRPGEPALFCLPDDEDRAVEVAELLLAHGADPAFRNPLGLTPAQAARRRGLDEAAAVIEDAADEPAARPPG